jgi:hypothetical protein
MSDETTPASQLVWLKSSASGSGNCVEVAQTEAAVYVRNSKRPLAGVVAFTGGEWEAFLIGVRKGEFDRTTG